MNKIIQEAVETDGDKITITRETPPELNYDILEMHLKHMQGQVLTIIEIALTDPKQLKATKDAIKERFNEKLTWLFDLYGHTTKIERETPEYSYPSEE